ncbi:MAG TPA: hypothetical protein VGM39_09175 [Kofleriaceae bacterium]|jgi:hypothetical protein
MRMALCAMALALGVVSAVAILLALPKGHNRTASEFASLTVFVAMSMGAAIAWYALLDAIRRRSPGGLVRVPSNLPVARLVPRRKARLV